MPLNEKQTQLCETNTSDYSDLKATIINTSLKKQANASHTKLLLDVCSEIMSKGA